MRLALAEARPEDEERHHDEPAADAEQAREKAARTADRDEPAIQATAGRGRVGHPRDLSLVRMSFTTRPELRGTFGAVASTHWLASASGMAVLERGGNAFDAACAAGFVLQVVEPHLNGPGGDLPAVFWSAERGEPLVLCAQGVAPARGDDRALSLARSRARAGHRPARRVRPGLVRRLAAAARAVRDLAARRRARVRDRLRGGRLPGRARDHGDDRDASEPLLREWPGSAELYLPAPRPGTTFRNPQLAATWRRLLDESRGGSREAEIERARQRLLRGVRRRGDRPLLARARRPAHGRRPRRVARDARAAGDGRLSRADRLQDGARGGRGRPALQQLRLLEGFDVGGARRGRARARRRRSARSSRSPTATRTTATRTSRSTGCSRASTPTSAGARRRARRAASCGRGSAGCRRSSPRRPQRSAPASRRAATPCTSTSPTGSAT